ncbi:MAG: PKD domain-containing protein [Armatimonadota bacterium]
MRGMKRTLLFAGMGLWCLAMLGCGGGNNNGPAFTARLTVDPPSGTNMTLFTCTAEGIDSQGNPFQPQQVAWDWTNDGVMELTATGNTTEHLYETPGAYQLHAQVKNAAGQTAQATTTVTVAGHDNPMALVVSVTPETGATATTFTFRVTAYEFLGNLQTRDQLLPSGYHRWDWEDDCVFDTPFTYFEKDHLPPDPSFDSAIEHQFTTPGVKQVRVQVKADDGRVATKVISVTVGNP